MIYVHYALPSIPHYTPPNSESSVISHTVVLALGHVAVALPGSKTAQTILHQCFLQRLCRPPSPLDKLIVDQMGCIMLAHTQVSIKYNGGDLLGGRYD